MGLVAFGLKKLMTWALAKNAPGGYFGEDDARWAYTITGPDGSPYLSRILLPRVTLLGRSFRPMLHYFHRPDADRDAHNHPWHRAASLVLTGSYDEERLAGDPRPDRYMQAGQCAKCGGWRGECPGHEPDVECKRVRWFNVLDGDDYHRVTRLHGDVFTLFVAGEQKDGKSWGFMVDGQHVDSAEYFKTRGDG